MRQITLQRIYTKKIKESAQTFEAIFEANFSHTEFPIFEYEENGEIKKVSYQDTKERIKEVAYNIEQKINVRDEFIGLNIDNSPNWVIGFWAILMSGNKPYLINSRHPQELTSSILTTLDVNYLLSDGSDLDFGRKSLQIADLNEKIPANREFKFANEMAISTSATTMNEKICLYSGKEILAQLSNTNYVLSKNKEAKRRHKKVIKLLAFLPFYHIFGLITVYFWFTYFGYTLVFLNDYSPNTILHTIRKHEVTHVFSVPLFWHQVEENVKKEVDKRDEKTREKFYKGIKKINNLQNFSYKLGIFVAKRALREVRQSLFGDSVKFCVTGGSYIRNSALELLSGLGYPLYNGYGTSEIGITSVELSLKPKDRLKGSVGMPLPSVTYEINNGTLCVKGKSTCHTIIVSKEKHLTNEYFDTLDIAHVDENGRYYIDGRKTDLIISDNGENVNPDSIEQHFDFSKYPVLYFSVLGLGENADEVSLVVEPSKKLLKEEMEDIRQYIDEVNSSLPYTHKIKSMYITYDDIQNKNAIKVSRTYLKRKLADGNIKLLSFEDALKKEIEYASTSLTETIIELFAEALNLDKSYINPNSHFLYDLHGSSLDYFALLSLINERFGIKLSFDPNNPLATPEDFERYINENK